MFSRLDDGRWELMALPFMKTRLLTDDEKQDRHGLLLVTMKSVLLMYLGLLIKTAVSPTALWMAIITGRTLKDTSFVYLFVLLAFAPLIVLVFIGLWPLLGAQKRLKYKKLLKTAPRGHRVKWAPFWRLVGSALGPSPIQIVFSLVAVCLFGTILLSQAIGDIYLTDIGNLTIFFLLLGPAIPAGLRAKHQEE